MSQHATFGFLGRPGDPLPRVRPEDVGLSPERLSRIGRVLEADIEAGKMPGAVIAIARRGRLAFFETYGYLDRAADRPMTGDALFSIASMTKPVTAVAALQLCEQGRLLPDDPLAAYFPEFSDMSVAVLDDSRQSIIETVPADRPILLIDLMRHTSGLIYGGRGDTAVHKLYPSGSGAAGATMTGAEFVRKLAALPLYHQPGVAWDYGFGLDLLGLVVEKVTGRSLGTYVREAIFEPLGMNDTAYLVPADKAHRLAQGPAETPGASVYLHDPRQPLKFECGGACLASTALDYLRFALALLNRGQFNGERILSRKMVEYMTANHIDEEVDNRIAAADPTRADYGFGLGVAVRTKAGVVPMAGSVGEFNWPGAGGTNWWADPREDLAVTFMAVTPGPVRWHYRRLVNALVYQAIAD